MIPSGPLSIGRVVRHYDHGYLVIWNDAEGMGLESTHDRYERIDELCPSPSHLLGSLVVYHADARGRAADWFTAFSEEQLQVLVDRKRTNKQRPIPTSDLLDAINGALSAARRTTAGDVTIVEYDLIGEEHFTRVWNARARVAEQLIRQNLP